MHHIMFSFTAHQKSNFAQSKCNGPYSSNRYGSLLRNNHTPTVEVYDILMGALKIKDRAGAKSMSLSALLQLAVLHCCVLCI